jgi:tetratricopeptide (TPR) repeat protein
MEDDHYTLLGLSRDATQEEIEKKVRSELRLWQRRTTSADLTRRQEAEQRVELLTRARAELLNGHGSGGTPPAERTVTAPARRQSSASRVPRPSPPRPTHNGTRRPREAAQPPPRRPQPAPTGDGEGERLLDQARTSLEARRYHRASEAARKAHSVLGPTAEVWLLQARANVGLGRNQDADYEIRQALDVAGDGIALLEEIAELYQEMGQGSRAQSIFQRIRNLPGGRDVADRGIAAIHIATGRLDDAIRLYEGIVRRTGLDEDREQLATTLMAKAERTPRIQRGNRYVVTNPGEIQRMRGLITRALELSTDPELQQAAERIRHYLTTCEQPGTPERGVWGYAAIMSSWLLPTLLLALVLAGSSLGVSIFVLLAGLSAGTVHTLAEYGAAGQPLWQVNDAQIRRSAPRSAGPLLEGPPRWSGRALEAGRPARHERP